MQNAMASSSSSSSSTLVAPSDPFYTIASRLRMPDGRPHTVHASSSSSSSSPFITHLNVDCADQEYDSSDAEDLTPRASAAEPSCSRGPDHYMHRRRLSRDDTHNDMHVLAEPLTVAGSADMLLYDDIPPHLTEQEFQLEQTRARRHRKQTNTDADHADTSKSASSIGRRFSKYSKDRVNNLRESMQRYALPVSVARGRRSSTPVPIDCQETACINPALLVKQPTSPTKRTARHDNDRPRKYRTHLFPSGDRKDTPAPTATLLGQGLPVRSATSSRFVPTISAAPGGDAARKAAAMHNHNQFCTSTPEWIVAEQDLHERRQRLGSLSSAADSGADLSTYSGSEMGSVRDSDGDVDMLQPLEPNNRDFTRQFPEELSLLVFQQLDAKTLLHAEQVCQKWNTMAKDVSVWRTMFLRRYQRHIFTNPAPVQVGGNGVGLNGRADQEWRKMYKARIELDKNWRAGADKAGKAVYLSGHTDSVYCLQFDEEKIITGSRDRTIRVWDINTYQCLRVIGGPNVRPVAGPKVLRTVDYPSFHMATASVNGTAYGDNIYHQPQYFHDASILCLQYDDKILVTGSSDSDLIVWDIKAYQPITRLSKHTGGVLDVALDSKHIISCSKDSRIIVWDRETLTAKGELIGHKGPVNAVQLRGHLLVSASGDGIARLWDINQMKLLKEFPSKERGLAAVEFSEDMKHVLAGGNDNITYKFETNTGAEVMQYTGHSQLVRSLWLDSANDRVVSGSYDLDLRVYDFTTGEELWRGEEWTTSWMLAAKSDYRRIVATSQDGRILIVDFGILKGAPTYQSRDGMPIDNIDLLRGIEHTSEIKFRNPFERRDTVTRRS